MKNILKDEIQHILQGKSPVSHGTLIQTIASYLRRSQATSELAKEDKQFKKQETEELKQFIDQYQLWVTDLNFDSFIAEGAEQRVFIKDDSHVYKLNDGIYYASWADYFLNLLLNNYFFPDTAYRLVGFYEEAMIIYALVEQAFIKANEATNLEHVKAFLGANGFLNNRNNDYYNPDLGIILEDLHDENVLTQDGILYFIDTVFYIKPEILLK